MIASVVPRAAAAGVAGALVALVSGGCGPSAEAREVDRVGRAIEVLRTAPAGGSASPSRLPLVTALEGEPVTFDRTRQARDACAAAYRDLEEASELEAQVRKDLHAQDRPAEEVLRALETAETKVKRSRDAMPGCEAAVRALRTP